MEERKNKYNVKRKEINKKREEKEEKQRTRKQGEGEKYGDEDKKTKRVNVYAIYIIVCLRNPY
jgi:hypothetical protein